MEASIPPLDVYVKYAKGAYLVMWSGKISGQRLETAAHQFSRYPNPQQIMHTKDTAVRAFWRASGSTLKNPKLKGG